MTIWIGELQWQRDNSFGFNRSPILGALNGIECRDALMNADGTEPEWPPADAIVGNPPFLGDKRMIGELGEDYVSKLRSLYKGRVPGGADLVTYWFEKAHAQIAAALTPRAGLVATNSIRGGANRKVLDRMLQSSVIFNAWGDEPWVVDGAAVRVSLVCFGEAGDCKIGLNGISVSRIFSDLTAGSVNITTAHRLRDNEERSFIGRQKDGPD